MDRRGPHIRFPFYPICQDKVIDCDLSTYTVKRRLKTSARGAELDVEETEAFSVLSMGVGAAQELLCAGLDMAANMRAGSWKSIDVLGRYLETAERKAWFKAG